MCPRNLWTPVLHKFLNMSRRSVCHFKLSLVVLSLPGLPLWRVWTLKSSWYQKLVRCCSPTTHLFQFHFELVDHFEVLQDCKQALSTDARLQSLEKSCVVWLARGVCKVGRDRHERSSNSALDGERRFRWSFLSPSGGTELRVSRCNIGIRVDDPCQDAGEDFGSQEGSKVVALLHGVSKSYAYCCQFGVPCDVSGLNLGRVRLSRRAVVEEVALLQERVAGDSHCACCRTLGLGRFESRACANVARSGDEGTSGNVLVDMLRDSSLHNQVHNGQTMEFHITTVVCIR